MLRRRLQAIAALAEVALSETRADLAAGQFVEESVDAHLERIEAMATRDETLQAT